MKRTVTRAVLTLALLALPALGMARDSWSISFGYSGGSHGNYAPHYSPSYRHHPRAIASPRVVVIPRTVRRTTCTAYVSPYSTTTYCYTEPISVISRSYYDQYQFINRSRGSCCSPRISIGFNYRDGDRWGHDNWRGRRGDYGSRWTHGRSYRR